MNSTGLQTLTRLMWAGILAIAFLLAAGLLGSERLDSLVQRPVSFVASFVPLELSHGFTSAILLASIAVVVWTAFFWLVMTAWNRLRSR